MMKKLLALLLVLTMLIPMLLACGGDGNDTPATDEPSGDTPATDEPSGDEPSGDTPSTDTQKQRETYEIVTAEGNEDGPYLIKTVYDTEQTVIADIIVTPEAYDVDPTGVKDSTAGIQRALDDCRTLGGGTVFLPVGEYLVTSTISLAEGVLLQGDWQDPDLTSVPEYGTVILAKLPTLEGDEVFDPTAKPLFKLLSENSGNNGLAGLTVFYPEQDIDDVKAYGYTVYAPNPGMAVLRNLTLLNSYRGIGICLAGGYHELVQIEGVRMTALATGYQAKRSNEIGYTYDLRISPKYWSEATGNYRCEDANALRDFCREYTTGMKFSSLDLNQYTGIAIEGCYTAMLIDSGFWGIFYGVDIKDSVYGIVARALTGASGVGIAHATIEADEYAVANYAVGGKPIKLTDVKVTGKGEIHSANGAYTMLDNSIDLDEYKSDYGYYQKPADILYVADVKALDGKHEDAAPAIQAALDKAAATGGIVYVPCGVYNFYTALSVPAGVELRGAQSQPARDRAYESGIIPGTVFLTYLEDGDFITLAESAGVQGVRIFSGNYDGTTALSYLEKGDARTESCVVIRGTGKDVYVLNTVISGGFVGIDFLNCDNHLIRDVYGCTYKNFIRAGGENGTIAAVLCNMTFTMRQPFYLRGMFDMDYCSEENWAVRAIEGNAEGKAFLRDEILRKYCDTIYVKDAVGETLNNVFMYGGHVMLIADNAEVVNINVTTDWQGICPMFVVENESDVIAFNPVRTVGGSHEMDDTSSLALYNRLLNIYPEEPTYLSTSGYADTLGGEPTNELTLVDGNSVKGTEGVLLNTDATYVKEGKGSLKHDGENPQLWLKASFDAVDTAELGDEQLYLHFWIWVDDPHGLQWGGQIELSTSLGVYCNWGTTQTLTKEGWNEVLLAIPRTGETAPVFTSIAIKVDHSPLKNYPTVYIDDISVCTVIPYSDSLLQETCELESYMEKDPANTQGPVRYLLNDCESLTSFTPRIQDAAMINTNPAYVKAGRGSLKVKLTSQTFYEQKIPITDIGELQYTGYLHFWIYVENPNVFNGSGQIELTSSGNCDIAEKGWEPRTYIRNIGWNEVYLPLKEAANKGTPAFNGSAVNYLRMYVNVTSDTTVYIDDVYVCNIPGAKYDESNTIEAGNAANLDAKLPVLHNCDSAVGITKAMLNTDAAYVKEGSGSLRAPDRGSDKLIFGFPVSQDISDYMDGYLHISVYVEDASRLNWGQIELTSSGTCDKDELGWLVTSYVKNDGWNELYLPLATASKLGSFNPKSCNFMRIYVLWDDGGDSPLMFFDDIRLVSKEDAPVLDDPAQGGSSSDEPSTPSATSSLVLHNCDSADEVTKATLNTDKAYVKEGTASLVAPSRGQEKLVIHLETPLDVSAYKDGYLHMWVYAEDASRLHWGQIELSSAGTCDKEELGWLVTTYIKKDGWNELYLPLSTASKTGGDFDAAALNYLRLFIIWDDGGDSTLMYFDDIRFVPKAEVDGSDTPAQGGSSDEPATTSLVLHNCDSADKVTKATLNTDKTYVKEGTASLVAPARGQEKLVIHLETPLDVSAYKDGYLHMWVYAEDASRLHWGQIELSSAGNCDKEELGWLVTTYIKKDGWNELYLPLSTASRTGGDFDATALNYFRLFIIWDDGGDSTPMYFDDIYFTNEK